MKTQKTLLVIGLCLIMVFAMAACSSSPAAESSAAASESVSSDTGASESAVAEGGIDPSTLTIAVSLGWLENEAGQRQKLGFEAGFEDAGITNFSFVDANYDAKKQSDQIEAIIKAKPDALLITPSDPNGITEAVKHAVEAGIPVFCSDGTVPNAYPGIKSAVIIDNYGGGGAAMEALAQSMGGKGKLAMITLDANDNWKQRGVAAYDVLKNYPDIEVVQTWSWDSTGTVTPRMAVDNFLVACPNVGDLDAVWCAWDGAVFEGLQSCEAAGRNEIKFVGFDGGQNACNLLMEKPDQFICTNSPQIFSQSRQCVLNAVDYLNGKDVPLVTFTKNVLLTGADLSKVPEGSNPWDYDMPGNAEAWGLNILPTSDASTELGEQLAAAS